MPNKIITMDRQKKRLIKEKILYFLSKRVNYPLAAPRNVTLTLNYICNQKCLMCDIKNRPFDRKLEIKVDEIKRIIDEMAGMNIPELVLTGGEPFLYDGLGEAIQHAKKKGIKVIVITNGYYDGALLRKISALGVDHFQISLDGSTAQIYEEIRGVKDAFDVVINNIKTLIAMGQSVGATATIVRQNYKDLMNIALLSRGLGCKRLALRPAHISNADPLLKASSMSAFWIPREQVSDLKSVIKELKDFNARTDYLDFSPGLDLLADYFEKGYLPLLKSCFIGYTRLIISYNEKDSYEVWMCGGMCGDIRKQTLKDIWFGKRAAELRKKIRKCREVCLFPELHEPDLIDLRTAASSVLRLLREERRSG